MITRINRLVKFFLLESMDQVSASARKRLVFKRINFSVFLISLSWLLLLFFTLDFNSNRAVFLVNMLPFIFSIITGVLTIRNQEVIAINLSLFIYPALLFSLAISSGQAVILNYIFIVSLLVFFFQNHIRKIVLFLLYDAVFFAAGIVFLKTASTELVLELFVVITIFALIFITTYTIKKELLRYEDQMKQLNNNLDDKNQELNIQKKITESQALNLQQKSVALAELNELKTKIFSNVSNELIDHIYFANNLLFKLENGNRSFRQMDEMIPELRERSENSKEVIERVLAWSKTLMQLSTPRPQLLDVGHLVKAVTNICKKLAESKKIDLLVKTEKGLNAFIDRDMIEVALRNVVDNTILSSKEGSTVGISALKKNDNIVLQIIDFGYSDAAKDGHADFELIGSANPSRSAAVKKVSDGIGIALSKELIEKNHCVMEQQYWEDMGSITFVYIPLSQISYSQ